MFYLQCSARPVALVWTGSRRLLSREAQIPLGFAQGKLFTPLRFVQDDGAVAGACIRPTALLLSRRPATCLLVGDIDQRARRFSAGWLGL